jgi:hypothetical protein
MNRRRFFGLSVAAGGLLAANSRAVLAQPSGAVYAGAPKLDVQTLLTQQQQFRIGYTTNTRGGWEGSPFVGISEGREVGFRYFEIFGASFCPTSDGLEPAPHDTQKMKSFPAIVAYLKSIDWRGHLNVELDTSPWRTPKESARITANYIRNTLKIEL